MTELTHVATYKDGGSKAFKDKYGNEYWQCFKLGKEYEQYRGKLFRGRIQDKTFKLALGEFQLIERKKDWVSVKTAVVQTAPIDTQKDGTVNITRDELKNLLGIIATVAGDHRWAENINTGTVYEIAERNGLEFRHSTSIYNTEKRCVDK